MPGIAPMVPPKRSKAPLVVGVIGGILVVAGIVVLVLWLAVWKDGGGGGAGDPIDLAEQYINAMEKGDADAYFACFEPEFFSMEDNPLMEEMGMDVKELIEMTFDIAEIKFDDYALELESEQGNKATVVTTSGNLSISSMGFEQEYDLAEEPMVFEMIKKNGRWYLSDDPMPGSMGGDMDLEDLNIEDLDLEDLDQLIPEDLNMEDFENMFPEDLNLEDLENMSEEDINQLLEELEKLMEDMPTEGNST
jgi:hypothetical protein